MRIETERLILREWNLNDIDDMVEGLNNFNVAKNLTTPFPYDEECARNFIEKHLKHGELDYTFAIVLKEEGKVIGGTALTKNSFDDKYKGGIWLNERYTGKGYGSEAFVARANFAFEVLGIEEIENGFYEYNEISFKMQKNIGYKVVGKKTNFCPALNREVVEVVTLLSKRDFYNALDCE